jgi:hypothetical protein
MTQPIEIYLGKNGQTFGPYTVEQFEAIKASADYETYTYIWDGRDPSPDWKPLEKAPASPAAPKRGPGAPPPDERKPQQTQPAQQPAPAATPERVPAPDWREAQAPAPARAMLRRYDVPGIEAICHDSRHVISGRLTQVTDSGCELVCSGDAGAESFGSKSRVVLNLLEPKSGRAMNVTARLSGVRRRDGQWSLKVLWKSCPELIVQQLENSA